MAVSPSHRFGQIIGNMLEEMFKPVLESIALKNDFYFDAVGKSRAARKGKKLSWKDCYDNTHDLDFVIEKGGSDDALGTPAAFIECAWRRYTKHSKNKAQEIQGAVLPIADRFIENRPFLGAILAGEFTAPSLTQLRTSGFNLIYIPYIVIVEAFIAEGLNIGFDEDTSTDELTSKVREIELADRAKIQRVEQRIKVAMKNEINEFCNGLELSLTRSVKEIVISPMFGNSQTFYDLKDAELFLRNFDSEQVTDLRFGYFRIFAVYGNGDEIQAKFESLELALSFLSKI